MLKEVIDIEEIKEPDLDDELYASDPDEIVTEIVTNVPSVEPLNLEEIANATLNDVKQGIVNLSAMCRRLKIPMFAAIADKDSVLGTHYISESVTPFDLGTRLRNDYISPMLLVLQGFDVVDPDKVGVAEIEME